jgi:hypothetical protein
MCVPRGFACIFLEQVPTEPEQGHQRHDGDRHEEHDESADGPPGSRFRINQTLEAEVYGASWIAQVLQLN